MNLEKMIQNYKTETKVIPREEKILETIQKSKEVMMEVQSEHTMSYGEFLFSQFRLIRKRWWMLQAALLIVTFFLMNYLDDSEYLMRTLGTSSVLFIVMIIPEFWRNKESDSLQIEAACLYSLRQIYSARVFLIGVADVFMITLFMFVCCVGMRMQFMDILVQFLFPMVVAAGICFAMLNSSALNEAASMLGCFLWSVIWWMVTMNDFIYAKITFPVWSILFGLASCFLIGAVYKAIHDCNRYVRRWREIYMKLQMVNVTRKFGNFRAVENLNLTIENGVYGLLGVNGAGKTTLMRMICTLLPPTSGQILCDGKDIFKMDGEYRNLLGYLPQEFGFYPDFTVKDYLLYIASLKGIRPMVAGKRVKDLLAQVGLTKSANKKMKKLSGGMKRRAGIAQAMLNNPKILILDEPTAGLDPTERVRFRNLISELSEDRIVILSTHIVSDVEYIANEIWLMKDGQIMQQGNLDQTLASMQEKVYACEVSQADATKMMKKFKVSNMKSERGMVELRIIAGEPPIAGASVVEPTLEDVFLYYFGEKGGEME